jgi:hypothetical protein
MKKEKTSCDQWEIGPENVVKRLLVKFAGIVGQSAAGSDFSSISLPIFEWSCGSKISCCFYAQKFRVIL